jgi:hypothetical protein
MITMLYTISDTGETGESERIMKQNHRGAYPDNWPAISYSVKETAGWRCIRCHHDNDSVSGHVLTVHHLDGDKSNCRWWNLAALCQRCHLKIQGRVIMERVWMFDHSEWFKPYVAGYYAYHHGLPDDRAFVEAHMTELIDIGCGRVTVDIIRT